LGSCRAAHAPMALAEEAHLSFSSGRCNYRHHLAEGSEHRHGRWSNPFRAGAPSCSRASGAWMSQGPPLTGGSGQQHPHHCSCQLSAPCEAAGKDILTARSAVGPDCLHATGPVTSRGRPPAGGSDELKSCSWRDGHLRGDGGTKTQAAQTECQNCPCATAHENSHVLR